MAIAGRGFYQSLIYWINLTLNISIMKIPLPYFLPGIALLLCCGPQGPSVNPEPDYFNNEGRSDILSGGVRMIEIQTHLGDFNVWTKRVGNNPDIKVLLLHGGPGATHEYMECFDSYFPAASIEYY